MNPDIFEQQQAAIK